MNHTRVLRWTFWPSLSGCWLLQVFWPQMVLQPQWQLWRSESASTAPSCRSSSRGLWGSTTISCLTLLLDLLFDLCCLTLLSGAEGSDVCERLAALTLHLFQLPHVLSSASLCCSPSQSGTRGVGSTVCSRISSSPTKPTDSCQCFDFLKLVRAQTPKSCWSSQVSLLVMDFCGGFTLRHTDAQHPD